MPEQTAWVVTDPDGMPLIQTASLARGIAEFEHAGDNWPWWESQGWTCKKYRLVPVDGEQSQG